MSATMPAPEALTEGLGAFLGPNGVASGAPTSKLVTWDYPVVDVSGLVAAGQGHMVPSWLQGVLVTDPPMNLQGGSDGRGAVGFAHGTMNDAASGAVVPAIPGDAVTQQGAWILCTTLEAWPVPTHLLPAPQAWITQIIAGPREHLVVNWYMTPGQWALLDLYAPGIYAQWVAAGQPVQIVMGQHDNSAGSGWTAPDIIKSIIIPGYAISHLVATQVSPQAGAAVQQIASQVTASALNAVAPGAGTLAVQAGNVLNQALPSPGGVSSARGVPGFQGLTASGGGLAAVPQAVTSKLQSLLGPNWFLYVGGIGLAAYLIRRRRRENGNAKS